MMFFISFLYKDKDLWTPPRQTSEDSGIEADAEELFALIPKVCKFILIQNILKIFHIIFRTVLMCNKILKFRNL